jgi:hypothetical protein
MFQVLFTADVAVMAGLASIIAHDLVIGRAISTARSVVATLVVIGVVQLGLWIWWGRRRSPERGRHRWASRRGINPPFPTTRPGRILAVVLLLVMVGAVVQAYLVATGPITSIGGPGSPTASCRWPLDNHGLVTCVTHTTYVSAVAEVQRFVTTVIMGFDVFLIVLSADAILALDRSGPGTTR